MTATCHVALQKPQQTSDTGMILLLQAKLTENEPTKALGVREVYRRGLIARAHELSIFRTIQLLSSHVVAQKLKRDQMRTPVQLRGVNQSKQSAEKRLRENGVFRRRKQPCC